MFCPRCGSRNEDTNNLCIMCGYKFEEKQEETECLAADADTVEALSEFAAEETASEIICLEPESQKIRHYLGWSIVAAILGSIVFGIAAVIFSGITKAELAAGDVDKAMVYSEHTKFFCLISLSVAIVKFIFVVAALLIFLSISQMPLFLY